VTIRAITFDFWATLYRGLGSGEERLRDLYNELRQDGHPDLIWVQTVAAARDVWQEWDQEWRTKQTTFGAAEWLSRFCRMLLLDLTTTHFAAIVHQMETMALKHRPLIVPEAKAVLPELAELYALGIISDTGISPGWVLRQILEDDGLDRYFRHCTFSDELGRSKPHPRAFASTLKALGVRAEEAVHVGDLPHTDIIGAQRAGMRAVRYRGVQDETDPHISADAVINHHAELAGILGRWETGDG
jgi:FMN hydrolase / 5-amino-6-(5-phospho-D-ribitylamino)uracil phosphatase